MPSRDHSARAEKWQAYARGLERMIRFCKSQEQGRPAWSFEDQRKAMVSAINAAMAEVERGPGGETPTGSIGIDGRGVFRFEGAAAALIKPPPESSEAVIEGAIREGLEKERDRAQALSEHDRARAEKWRAYAKRLEERIREINAPVPHIDADIMQRDTPGQAENLRIRCLRIAKAMAEVEKGPGGEAPGADARVIRPPEFASADEDPEMQEILSAYANDIWCAYCKAIEPHKHFAESPMAAQHWTCQTCGAARYTRPGEHPNDPGAESVIEGAIREGLGESRALPAGLLEKVRRLCEWVKGPAVDGRDSEEGELEECARIADAREILAALDAQALRAKAGGRVMCSACGGGWHHDCYGTCECDCPDPCLCEDCTEEDRLADMARELLEGGDDG